LIFELRNSPAHLLVTVDAEALLLGHARQLDVLRIQLLFHDLLQSLQNQRLGLGERQRAVVFVLQLRLRALTSRADSLSVIPVECTRGLGVISIVSSLAVSTALQFQFHVQLRPVLIITGN